MEFSYILPILVTLSGIFLLFRLRFFFILHPLRSIKLILSDMKDERSRSALALALAGTLGVGNVFGVCAGLIIGGAGSVFWLFISSFFSMVIKYSECVLSHDSLRCGKGGMHYVVLSVLGGLGGTLSRLYAALCAALALLMGSALQSNAFSDISAAAFDIPPQLPPLILTIFLLFAALGGASKIEKITAKLIPLTTIIYIFLTFGVILVNFSRLPSVVNSIFKSAFSPLSAGGGILAFLSSRPLREGYARGILSNEAGAGTSSLAHTRSGERTAVSAGLCGVAEVFFDTTLLCMLTALAVLCAVDNPSAFSTPMSLISYAVTHSLGRAFLAPLLLSIFVFAYSTIICWYYYGGECISYLFGERMRTPFAFLFFIFIPIGARFTSTPLILLTDAALLLMSVLTLLCILIRHRRIRELTEESGLLKKISR